MAIPFPTFTGTPNTPNVVNYKEETIIDPTIRSRIRLGKQQSRKNSFGLLKFSFRYSFLTPADKIELQDFESDTVNYGSQEFVWIRDSDQKQFNVRFGKQIKFSQEIKEGRWNAKIELIEVRSDSGLDSFIYSRGGESSLPSSDDNLDNLFTSQELEDVETDNGVRVSQSDEDFSIFLFKVKTFAQDTITIDINVRTDRATSSSTVFLQIFNRETSSWETLDSDSTTASDIDFDLNGYKGSSLNDYFDSNFYVSARVYQEAI